MAVRIGNLERAEQIQVFAWAKALEGRHPELLALHAVPNFALLGPRTKQSGLWVASRIREGMRAGVPDLDLPVPRGGYIGLRIEMKRTIIHVNKKAPPRREHTQPTEQQLEWMERLRSYGHRVVVCWTAEEAQNEILAYLRLPPTIIANPPGGP